MHPPFGFALFYLRSVAAKVPYVDKITGLKTDPVTTAQIYWGAVPFVIIQVIMVGITLMFPQMVMRYKGEPATTNAPALTAPAPAGGGLQAPAQPGLAPLGGQPALPGQNAAPAIPGQAPAPAAPGAVDLSQPPKIN